MDMTHEQKPESAEFRTRDEQIVMIMCEARYSDIIREKGLEELFDTILAEAEARGAAERDAYQSRVDDWMAACFGAEISADRMERNHRFLEEAIELVQSTGCTQSEAHQLVDYVYGRPIGEPIQEVGGVMVTLAALCSAHGITLKDASETELARVWTKVEKIRAKQAAKPKHSPLPEHVTEQRRKDAEGVEEWRPMNTAPKDGTPVLVKTVLTPETFGDIRSHWNGRFVVVQHEGMTASGFDLRWRVACPVGFGGIPDEWFEGWRPVDRPANVAALEARVKELEGALKEAAYALERVKDGERGGYNARNGKFVSLQMSDGERADIIHSEVTEDCERALEAVRAAIREGGE